MATVELRPSGSRILRYPPGEQPLLTAGVTKCEFVWLSTLDQVVLLRRHWNQQTEATEPCLCNPICGSSRIDRCVAVALRTSHDVWEERLLLLPEEGWRSFERAWLLQTVQQPDPMGARCSLQRTGSRRNGRTCCVPLDWVDNCPGTFNVLAACRRQLHVAGDFFGQGDEDRDDSGEVKPQGKASEGKPRVAKGRPQRR